MQDFTVSFFDGNRYKTFVITAAEGERELIAAVLRRENPEVESFLIEPLDKIVKIKNLKWSEARF